MSSDGIPSQFWWGKSRTRKWDDPFSSDPISKLDGYQLEDCRKLMTDYDSATVDDWRDGINTHLVVVRPPSYSFPAADRNPGFAHFCSDDEFYH